MDYSDSIVIAASPESVFTVISDLPGMGRWSLENTGGEWLGVEGPCAGAKFKGTNSRDGDTWSTTAKVLTYDPPTSFIFDVTWHNFRISRWEFRVESAPGGCRVTESWTDRRNALLRRDGDSDGFSRSEFTKESIHTTLVRLKEHCESTVP